MAVLTRAMEMAVATASQRSTFAGGTWRSAIAPNISGEIKAATAEAAKAKGLMPCNPCVSRIGPSGTNQMAIAAPWTKNRTSNSKYSALRNVVSTGGQVSALWGKLKKGTAVV